MVRKVKMRLRNGLSLLINFDFNLVQLSISNLKINNSNDGYNLGKDG